MSFQKFAGIPVGRYTDLLDTEKKYKSMGTLKQTTDALVKNQETQEHIQRVQEYKEQKETIPKTLDKQIPQKAITILPPPTNSRKRQIPYSNVVLPVIKRKNEVSKRKPRVKKPAEPKKPQTGLSKWEFIKDE